VKKASEFNKASLRLRILGAAAEAHDVNHNKQLIDTN
jgi:hypothetical protein